MKLRVEFGKDLRAGKRGRQTGVIVRDAFPDFRVPCGIHGGGVLARLDAGKNAVCQREALILWQKQGFGRKLIH